MMKKDDFCKDLAEMLEIDESLTADSDLSKIEEFDSLAIMSIIAYADQKFAKKINGQALSGITTVESLMAAIGSECFE